MFKIEIYACNELKNTIEIGIINSLTISDKPLSKYRHITCRPWMATRPHTSCGCRP